VTAVARTATHVALLRAVNVAGHNPVGMAQLCALLPKLRLENGRSLLQSGNLVFRAPSGRSSPRLERALEDSVRLQLGLQTDFFVRTAAEWNALVAVNPFPDEARRDPGHLLVMFLKSAPDSDRINALERAVPGRELARVNGREAYFVYPDGIGRSRLTTRTIERCLETRATGRNWNTVLKLAACCGTPCATKPIASPGGRSRDR
jgi:uncharacterized protein (DUF1697 family)